MAEAQGTLSGAPTTMAGKFQVRTFLNIEENVNKLLLPGGGDQNIQELSR